jgi:hypothetical protein
MSIKKPTRLPLGKPKRVARSPDPASIAYAASLAVYSRSQYHCRGPQGQPLATRAKPASPCPRQWSDEDATTLLRGAMFRGHLSEKWENGFPRYVWHRDGIVFYEARHTRGPIGSYHAYPIEDIQLPLGIVL